MVVVNRNPAGEIPGGNLPDRRLSNIHKIAVLRANALGDYIFTLPALLALRETYPEAEIVLLGLEWQAKFLKGRPGPVDRVIVVPGEAGLRYFPVDPQEKASLESFFTEMQAEHFDLALQMYGGGALSNEYLLRLGARHTAGLKTENARVLERWAPYIYFQPEFLRFLEVAGLVGASTAVIDPCISLLPSDLEEANAVLPTDERPLIAFHLGAGDARRRWPPEKFARVARQLYNQGARIVVTGTQQEAGAIDRMLALAGSDFENLCGRLSLGGLAGLFSRAALVISNDSGPAHLARATGTASVIIYWCGNLINAGPATRSRHRPLISWRLDCPVCGRDIIYDPCPHEVSFVDKVSETEVLQAAYDLLGWKQPEQVDEK